MKKILNIIIVLILCSLSLSAENKYNFKATNGPYAGYIKSLCFDSTNSSVYANSDKIYKLNKISDKWEKQFDTLDKYSDYFYELIYADNIYFISFTEGHSDVIMGNGLLRSTDKGITWEEVNDFDKDVKSIVKLGNEYFAATGYYDGGVYKSTDYGITWSEYNNGIDSAIIHDGRFYQLEVLKSDVQNYLFLMENNNIFRSADSGTSWQNISGNISAYTQDYWAMTSTIDNKIFVVTDSAVFTSTDYGDTWQNISNGIQTGFSLNNYFLKSDKVGNVYAGGYYNGLLLLRKNENTWEKFNKGLIPITTNDIGFDYSSNTAYCATDGGIYKSEYLNENWEFSNDGINTPIEIECLAVTQNGEVFSGSHDNGIYFSSDKGANWEVRNNGITDNSISKIKIDSKGNIFAGTYYGNIFKSSDNGLNWFKLHLGTSSRNFSITDLSINSKDLLVGFINYNNIDQNDSLLISKDGGNIWERIYIPAKFICTAVFDNNDNLFVAADSVIMKTSNNGTSWEEVFQAEGYIGIFNFFVSKNNDIFFVTRRNKIYRSTDGGDSWLNFTYGFPDDCNISCISSPDIENRIIAGSYYDGYFVSKDNGETWEHFKVDFPPNELMIQPEEFMSLAYDHNGTMYAATYSGVYKWDAITSVAKSNKKESKYLISPNPATDFIDINLKIDSSLIASELQIFNMLGTEMISVGTGLDLPTQRIDVSELPSGVYYIKIGDRVEKFVKM